MTYITTLESVEDLKVLNEQADLDKNVVKNIEADLDQFSLLVIGFCPGETHEIDEMLNILSELINHAKPVFSAPVFDVVIACKLYIEAIILESNQNIGPVEEGIVLLKAALHSYRA